MRSLYRHHLSTRRNSILLRLATRSTNHHYDLAHRVTLTAYGYDDTVPTG